jgi:hypothetical protein
MMDRGLGRESYENSEMCPKKWKEIPEQMMTSSRKA